MSIVELQYTHYSLSFLYTPIYKAHQIASDMHHTSKILIKHLIYAEQHKSTNYTQ